MSEQRFELKLADGRVVDWVGNDGEDAARRYVDCKGGTVVAWRTPRVGIYQWGRGERIVQ